MERHFDAGLNNLKAKILLMGDVVECQPRTTLKALTTREAALATQVIENDRSVDTLDVEINEENLRLLALYHPTAGDLRFITTVMKIAGELERMSDLAGNIAERTIELNDEPQLKPYIDIPAMADRTIRMVRESLDAFVNRDAQLARKVCRVDEPIDELT